MRSEETWWAAIGKVGLGGLLLVVCVLADAWGLTVLWKWFVMPLFPVGALTLAEAAGISLLVTFIMPKNRNGGEVDWVKTFALGIFGPVFYVGLGWVIHLFL